MSRKERGALTSPEQARGSSLDDEQHHELPMPQHRPSRGLLSWFRCCYPSGQARERVDSEPGCSMGDNPLDGAAAIMDHQHSTFGGTPRSSPQSSPTLSPVAEEPAAASNDCHNSGLALSPTRPDSEPDTPDQFAYEVEQIKREMTLVDEDLSQGLQEELGHFTHCKPEEASTHHRSRALSSAHATLRQKEPTPAAVPPDDSVAELEAALSHVLPDGLAEPNSGEASNEAVTGYQAPPTKIPACMQTAGAKRAAAARERAAGGDAVDDLLSQLQQIEQAYGKPEPTAIRKRPELAPPKAKVTAAEAIKKLGDPRNDLCELVNCSQETLKIAKPERRGFRDSLRSFVGREPKVVHGLVNCSSLSRSVARKG